MIGNVLSTVMGMCGNVCPQFIGINFLASLVRDSKTFLGVINRSTAAVKVLRNLFIWCLRMGSEVRAQLIMVNIRVFSMCISHPFYYIRYCTWTALE